jgi:CHAD domain-containing protein
MWPHVERLLRFEQSLTDAAKTDDLKRYRVATRRLRAALRLFADAWPGKKVRKLRDELGELGRAAGTVRDLDVRMADLEGWAAAEDEGIGPTHIRPLVDAWREEREGAATDLLERVGSDRHQRLLRDVVEFAEGGIRLTADGRRIVRDTAASRIWKAFEQLRERGSLVNWTELPATHEIRIDAKRLRYSLEFLGDVLRPDRDSLIERLVRVQDHLGAINDAATVAAAARGALQDRGGDLQPDERASIERYAADREHDIATLQAGISAAWDPIAAASFARRLGRTVVIV